MRILIKKAVRNIRYGTWLQAVHRRFYRMGVNIFPYYLVQERMTDIDLPELKDSAEEFHFEFLGPPDFKEIARSKDLRGSEEEFLGRLKQGEKCLGAKHAGKIVAYGWMNLEECHYTGNRFRLKENEAYLFDMYTSKPYRGKNIAPHLRHQIYKALNEMGKDTFYSVSEVFNKPSIKFKKKLNARFLRLCVFIELFKKNRFHFTLKKYKA